MQRYLVKGIRYLDESIPRYQYSVQALFRAFRPKLGLLLSLKASFRPFFVPLIPFFCSIRNI